MQVALVFLVLMLFSVPFYVIHEAQQELEYIFKTSEHEITVISQNIAVNSIDHIVTRDYTSLDKLLIRSARFPGVIDIQVTKPDGAIISDIVVKDGKNTDATTRYNIANIHVPSTIDLKLTSQQDRMDVWAPIESGSHLGWVKIAYSMESVNKHGEDRIWDHLQDGAFLTLILVASLLLFMKKPLNMISTAVQFAGRLDEKTGEQLTVPRQSTEIEQLFNVLNKVSLSLSDQDIVIHKVLKELETQKHALDEHSIVSIWDTDGVITYANNKLTQLTGYSQHELCGKKCFMLNHHCNENPSNAPSSDDIWSTISSGDIWHGEMHFKMKQGGDAWLNTTIIPFIDESGHPYEYVNIQTDITEQKNAEKQLEEKNKSLKELTDNLEVKVIQRTAELESANQQLQHLNSMKSEFVSVVSHELRTPLTSIKSFAEILEDDIEEIDLDTQRHYLSIINEETDRLGRLINDVLDLQKMDAGKTNWNDEKTDLAQMAMTLIELFSKSYEDKGLNLSLDMPEEQFIANVDADKIQQLTTNLLSNALKFTAQGGVTLALKTSHYRPQVLVLKNNADAMLPILKAQNFNLISVDKLHELLNLLENTPYLSELLIIDLSHSHISIEDAVEDIRKKNTNVPVLIITSEDVVVQPESLLKHQPALCIGVSEVDSKLPAAINEMTTLPLNSSIIIPTVEVSVTDTGIGIPRDELQKVFARFHQVDSSETRETGGSGLGLAICRDIVEHYHGKIWVESTPQKGSRFAYILPLDTSHETEGSNLITESASFAEQQNSHIVSSHK